MILSTLKKVSAAYHHVATSALTVDSVDLFLVAANNVKNNAQLLHNFEMSRVRATLNIDGETGGSLDDAVFEGDTDTLTVTGTLSPAATGTYTSVGTYQGYKLYANTALTFFLRYSVGDDAFVLSTSTQDFDGPTNYWSRGADVTIIGTYAPTGSVTGTATVARGLTERFERIKEIVGVARTNADGVLTPIDFTRADIPLERDRYAGELDTDYSFGRRYPSDAQILNIGSTGSLIQRGTSVFVYPLDTITSSPLAVTLECYGWLADYDAESLTATSPSDFFIQYGSVFMQWAIICELNHLFTTFVPRTEGGLSAPTEQRDAAWRDLLLWDTYMIDANATRSR